MITLDDEALEEMKHECVSYCRELFADNDIDVNRVLETILEDPIRRIKAGAFSAETLKLVYIGILKNLPYYRDEKRGRNTLLQQGLRICVAKFYSAVTRMRC